MYLILDPSVVYSVSSKVDVYVMGFRLPPPHHDGKWSSILLHSRGKLPATVCMFPRRYWSPTKKVYVNPYLSYQLSNREFDKKLSLTHMDIGLQLQYTFL